MTDQRLGSWISPPGETIEDLLDEKGWSKAEFASRLGCSPKHVSELLSGKAPITTATAIALARVLGSTPSFWLERERRYREELKRQEELDALESESGWLRELPFPWMVKEGLVGRYQPKGRQVEALLSWFGVASVSAWRTVYGLRAIAFRKSPSFDVDPGALAVWLRRAELEAEKIRTGPWNRRGFAALVRQLRGLTLESSPESFVPQIVERCAEQGVAVILTPTPPKCPVSGLVKWLTKDKAMVVLSLRHKTNDHLWYTFFHEAGHLLLHSKKLVFVEGSDGIDASLEREADEFSKNLLIPPDFEPELPRIRSEEAILHFAERLGIHPGIVVGRLQKEGYMAWNRYNHLKQKYGWAPGPRVVSV